MRRHRILEAEGRKKSPLDGFSNFLEATPGIRHHGSEARLIHQTRDEGTTKTQKHKSPPRAGL